jgi:hypothetical protein
VQVFGEQSRDRRPRQRREIIGIVRFKRPALPADRDHAPAEGVVDFDDDISDLFRSG